LYEFVRMPFFYELPSIPAREAWDSTAMWLRPDAKAGVDVEDTLVVLGRPVALAELCPDHSILVLVCHARHDASCSSKLLSNSPDVRISISRTITAPAL